MYLIRVFLIWLLIGATISSFAQFDGGNGDGFVRSFGTALTLGNQNINSIYQGSNGDGFDINELNSVTLNNTTLEPIYSGGNNDGYDNSTLSSITLDNTALNTLYAGANGDGYDNSTLSSTTLDNTSLTMLYVAGNGDGFDRKTLNSITLTNLSIEGLYSGSNSDGFDLEVQNGLTLTNLQLDALYGGGNGDGFDKDQVQVYLDTTTVCVRIAQLIGTPANSDVQISTMTNSNNVSPQNYNNAFLILRSKEKGFVLTRMANPETAIGADAVEGMIVYDSDDECIKLYNGTSWNCIIRRCPD